MPQSIPVTRKQQADSHVLPNIVVILATIVLATFLAVTFPARTIDSEAPMEATQLWAP